MLNVRTATTEELELFVCNDIEMRGGETDTALLFAVLEELSRRNRDTAPARSDVSYIRAKMWWQLVCKNITQEEYRNTVLSTAMSERERTLLEAVFIPRSINQALKCQQAMIEHSKG
jgi:hypothetical protein